MKSTLRILAGFSILLFISCSGKGKKGDAKTFYFPYQNFLKETVYKYVNENDSSDFSFWKMHMGVSGKDTFLFTEILNKKNEVSEKLKEKLVGNGSIMISYQLFSKDSAGSVSTSDCEIKTDTVFKWKFNSNDSCLWKVNYTENGSKMELAKSRMFTGDSVSVNFSGKDYMCMEFYDRFDLKTNRQKGEPQHFSYFIQSYYANGLGMVRYKVSLPGKKRQDFSLVRIN